MDRGGAGRDPACGRRSLARVGSSVLAAAVAAVVLLVLAAAPASAHARLRTSDPAVAETVATAPMTLRLSFTEVVDVAQSRVEVTGPDGGGVPTRVARDPADATTLLVSLPDRLARGSYAVAWSVLSLDGHPAGSEFSFAVGAATSPPVTEVTAGLGPTVLGGTARALADAGLLLLVGLTAFPVLVLRRARRRAGPSVDDVRPRLAWPMAGALLLALLGTALLAVDTAARARGFAPGQVAANLDELTALLVGSRTGVLLVVREAGLLVLAGWLLAGSRGAVGGEVGRLGLAVALLGTVSLSSHASASPSDAWLAVAVDWTHLAAAGAWSGGLLALGACAVPAGRALARRDPAAGAEHVAACTTAFSDLAQLCMLAVLATGTYATLVHVGGLQDLGRTAWGAELVVKVGLWLAVVAVAGVTAVGVVPRVSGRAGSLTGRLASAGHLARAVHLELAAAAALIAVAAVLAATAPPDQLI